MDEKDFKDYTKQLLDINDIEDFSDGYHTFKSLYYQRLVLFATLVNQNRDLAWKTHRHEDGELCFGGGWFLVTLDNIVTQTQML